MATPTPASAGVAGRTGSVRGVVVFVVVLAVVVPAVTAATGSS